MGFCGPVDTFDGPSFAAHWTGGYGTRVIDGGRAKMTQTSLYSAVTSATGYALTANELLVEVAYPGGADPALAGQEWYLMYRADVGAHPGIGNNAGTLYAYTAGSNVSLGTYSATTHRWVRLRQASGTLYWETSSDGSTWTTRHSAASSGYTLGSGYLDMGAGGGATAGHVFFDNLNNPPNQPLPATLARTSTVLAPTATASSTPAPGVLARTSSALAPTFSATATPNPALLPAAAAFPAASVFTGSDVAAGVVTFDGTTARLAPSVSASADLAPAVLARAAGLLLPEPRLAGDPSTPSPVTLQATTTLRPPSILDFDDPAWWTGVLSRWNGTAWQPGRLHVASEPEVGFLPGSLMVAKALPNTLRALLNDSTRPHHGVIDGVPTFTDWGIGPRVGLGNSPGPTGEWTAAAPWVQVYPEYGFVPATSRVAVRRVGMAVLATSTQLWTVLVDAFGASLEGDYEQYDFSGNAVTPAPLGRDEDGNVIGNPGLGWSMKVGPAARVPVDPGDVAAVIGWAEAAIEPLPGQPDTTSTDRYLAGAGGDWWVDLTTAPTPTNHDDWAIGRHRILSSGWQLFTGHTLTERQIRSNPPPVGPTQFARWLSGAVVRWRSGDLVAWDTPA